MIHSSSRPSVLEGVAEVKGILHCMQKAKTFARLPCNLNALGNRLMNLLLTSEPNVLRVFVDGAFSFRQRTAGCGGVLRRPDGSIHESFYCCVDCYDSFTAELWGCFWGLRRAWEEGFRNIVLLSDSQELINRLKAEGSEMHEDQFLLFQVKQYLQRSWEVDSRWTERELNVEADSVARESLSVGFGLQILSAETSARFFQEKGVP